MSFAEFGPIAEAGDLANKSSIRCARFANLEGYIPKLVAEVSGAPRTGDLSFLGHGSACTIMSTIDQLPLAALIDRFTL